MADRRVISGIIPVIRSGLMWRDAPAEYGPPKTLSNRYVRWSTAGGFTRIFSGRAAASAATGVGRIDAPHLKAHRTAASRLNKGRYRAVSAARVAG